MHCGVGFLGALVEPVPPGDDCVGVVGGGEPGLGDVAELEVVAGGESLSYDVADGCSADIAKQ